MATGVLKSFNRDRALAIVRLDGRSAEVALRVSGPDQTTIANLKAGQKMRFDLACNRHGQVHAVDVVAMSLPSGDVGSAQSARRSYRPPPSTSQDRHSAAFGIGPPDDKSGGLPCTGQQDLEKELLAAPVIHRLMDKGRVDPLAVQRLVRSVARAAVKQQ